MKRFIYAYILLIIIYRTAHAQVDYCNKKLCPDAEHVACNNDGEFSSDCHGEVWLEDLSPHIKLILHLHNKYRNQLASGNLEGFRAATRMPVLSWDASLVETSEFNVKTCKFAHDACRNTPKYKYSGQNIYTSKGKDLNVTIEEYIEDAHYKWFIEYEDAEQRQMEKYFSNSKKVGHFATLMSDRQNNVGCSFSNNLLPGRIRRRQVIFTCNYSSAHIPHFPIYKSGPTLLHCTNPDQKYTALCADKINPNDLYWYKKI